MVACWSLKSGLPGLPRGHTIISRYLLGWDCFKARRVLLHFLSSGAWTPSSLALVFCSRNALIQLLRIFRSCFVPFPACTVLTPLLALGSLLWEVGFQVKAQLLLAIKSGRLPRGMPSFTALCFFGVTPSRPGSGQHEGTRRGTLTGWTA